MSNVNEKEKEILKFWQENKIFEKSLEKSSPKGEFIFYEGPPTANGKPGIHHLLAQAFKDVIPRYKTMQGFHVRRKGGWDTHGLPVELEVERQLGLKSKKEIEEYGIALFNEKCKESVWKYVDEWQKFTERVGYWVDQKNAYVTYKPEYIETVWWVIKQVADQQLLFKDYKVVPWCPRCGTVLSSHELAQGYEDVKDLAVTVKFKITNPEKIGSSGDVFLLAWTTTPWTLPGNVGLAVNSDIEYISMNVDGIQYIIASNLISKIFPEYDKTPGEILTQSLVSGKDLVGLEYEPLYPFLLEKFKDKNPEAFEKAYKVYSADFVNTEDGTGIVHTAVMYGPDDFELGTKVGLPKYHLVNEDGHFVGGTGFLSGRFVKDEDVAVDIVKDLVSRELLFKKEKVTHSYPHCWRCKTPLIYYARDSWYIKMSQLREDLTRENEKINWEPAHIKNGRFGEWLREVKDWAISRERYWGTPLPVWECYACKKTEVIGAVEELKKRSKSTNSYLLMRHGATKSNGGGTISDDITTIDPLTEEGRDQVKKSALDLRDKKIDLIVCSPFQRTKETAEIVAEILGIEKSQIAMDKRLGEIKTGMTNKTWPEYWAPYPSREDRLSGRFGSGENLYDVRKRSLQTLFDLDKKYSDKNILIVTHEGVTAMLQIGVIEDENLERKTYIEKKHRFYENAEVGTIDFWPFPHNKEYELDLHRPYIDEIKFVCECGGNMIRVKEVMDVWLDSGAMPFAQDHYPFPEKELLYPADFISEAIDQTRGWFYTLLAIGVLVERGTPYKNVICLGHILDADGKKMSKSVGNVVNPWDMIEKYGADVLRFWMYSVNQPGESKNFDEKSVDEVRKKVFNTLENVLKFYEMYSGDKHLAVKPLSERFNRLGVLDKWIFSLLNKLILDVTESLDNYKLLEATRAIKDFITDLSQWYVRRSRDRFKIGYRGEVIGDRENALKTLRHVLVELSKLMAPFTPFIAEEIYNSAGGEKESVHLEDWPEVELGIKNKELRIIDEMQKVRYVVTQALELRSKANIKVRQPLSLLRIKDEGLRMTNEYLELIRNEVNVKEVVVGDELSLDTNITPELAREGEYRDLLREVQDLRKENGLKPGELVTLTLPEKYRDIISGFEDDFKKTVSSRDVLFGDKLEINQ